MALDGTSQPWHESACGCAGCMADTYLADQTGSGTEGVSYGIDPSSGESGLVGTIADNGLPIWSAYQTAQHIANFTSTWADDGDDPGTATEVTFRFYDAAGAGGADYVFDAVNQAHTRDILAQYAEVAD
ncbi:MAG: hypothetical protein AAFO58_01270, partial [Pseudomonadota bacterium]